MAVEVRSSTQVSPQAHSGWEILKKLDVDSLGRVNVPHMVLDLTVKAGILEELLLTDQLEQERIPEVADFAQNRFLRSFINPNHWAEGIDNIRQATVDAKKTGKRTIWSLRHDADADHLVWRYVFDHEGLREEADNTVFVAGVNMLKRPGIKIFMRAEHVIYIATPADITRARILFKEGEKVGIDDQDRQLMEWAYGIFIATNLAAEPKFEGAIERRETIGVYPEAGRSYDGFMKQVTRYIAEAYFPKDDGALIVPMRMYGAKRFNPPNKILRFHKALPGLREDIGLRAGPLYSSSEVWGWMEKRSENPGDMIAAHIANIDPTDIRVSDLLRYQRLMDVYHKEINHIWLPEGLGEIWEN